MKLAIFTRGRHDPDCTGCPACSEDNARMLKMTDAEWSAHNIAAICADMTVMRGNALCSATGATMSRRHDAAGLDGAPAPPNLLERIRAARLDPRTTAERRTERLRAAMAPPPPPDGTEPWALTQVNGAVRQDGMAPPPPSLEERIREAKKRGAR